jgi:hypothetical protein
MGYPMGNPKTKGKGFGVEAMVAFDLATGEEVWRSKPYRHGGLRCNNTAQLRVGGEMLICTPGGDVLRARDGKLVIREIGWTGYGNAAGVKQEQDGTGIVVWNEGCRRWSPRWGHHLRAYRLRREGDEFRAEKLWEWGWENTIGGTQASSPVIVDGPSSPDASASAEATAGRAAAASKVFIGGNQGYVFDMLEGTPLIAPSDASKDGVKTFSRAGHVPKMQCAMYLNPIAVGEHLYMAYTDGTVKVYSSELEPVEPKKDGDPKWQPKLLHENRLIPYVKGRRKPPLPEWTIASPQVWEDCLYIRQNAWLWCIGEGQQTEEGR